MGGDRRIVRLGHDGQLVIGSGVGRQTIASAAGGIAFLLVDCSWSMTGLKLTQARLGAEAFARDALAGGYTVGVIRFGADATVQCPARATLGFIEDALGGLAANGSTNLTAGLELAGGQMSASMGPRAAIVITDGRPDDVASALAAGERLRAAGIRIMAIGTDDADLEFLQRLSTSPDMASLVDARQLALGIAAAAALLPAPADRG